MIYNSLVMNDLGIVLSYFFPLWPVVVFCGIAGRRNALNVMILLWAVMGGVWVLTLFGSTRLPSLLILEPLNTLLFFVTGAIFLSLLAGRTIIRRSRA